MRLLEGAQVVLNVLHQIAPASCAQVARLAAVSCPTAQRHINMLTAAGYVEYVGDGRADACARRVSHLYAPIITGPEKPKGSRKERNRAWRAEVRAMQKTASHPEKVAPQVITNPWGRPIKKELYDQ